MKNKWYIIFITGFALFSMFFGSGNLVFPLIAGQGSGGAVAAASFGFLITGVLVPFLGVFAMMLYKGDLANFFSCFGKKATFWFSLFALAIMGPFGVLARCLTVAYGSLRFLLPDLTLPLTSWLLCGIIFLLTINRSKIITVLGSYLTPLLLGTLFFIAFYGLKDGTWPEVAEYNPWFALKLGFFQGYQTMDLLAAFFFSTFILKYLEKVKGIENQPAHNLKFFIQSSFIGATVLAIVYVGLIVIGGKHALLLADVPPQEMLGAIALATLGPMAAPIVCIAVVLACMTTAIVLTSLFADFLHKEIAPNKVSHTAALLITLGISFFVSTLDFAGIAKILGPILEAIYPSLIILTVVNIVHKLLGFRRSHWPITIALAAKLCI